MGEMVTKRWSGPAWMTTTALAREKRVTPKVIRARIRNLEEEHGVKLLINRAKKGARQPRFEVDMFKLMSLPDSPFGGEPLTERDWDEVLAEVTRLRAIVDVHTEALADLTRQLAALTPKKRRT